MPVSQDWFNKTTNQHNSFEKEVNLFLIEKDFLTDTVTYHNKMGEEIGKRLCNSRNPLAIYLRHRADRIAIHKELDIVFDWEVKTHNNPDKEGLCIDLISLAVHFTIHSSMFNADCLFAYKNPYNDREVGFWISQMPDIKAIFLNVNRPNLEWYRKLAEFYFPDKDIVEISNSFGSGDPFVVIKEETLNKLLHWKILILKAVGDSQR